MEPVLGSELASHFNPPGLNFGGTDTAQAAHLAGMRRQHAGFPFRRQLIGNPRKGVQPVGIKHKRKIIRLDQTANHFHRLRLGGQAGPYGQDGFALDQLIEPVAFQRLERKRSLAGLRHRRGHKFGGLGGNEGGGALGGRHRHQARARSLGRLGGKRRRAGLAPRPGNEQNMAERSLMRIQQARRKDMADCLRVRVVHEEGFVRFKQGGRRTDGLYFPLADVPAGRREDVRRLGRGERHGIIGPQEFTPQGTVIGWNSGGQIDRHPSNFVSTLKGSTKVGYQFPIKSLQRPAQTRTEDRINKECCGSQFLLQSLPRCRILRHRR